MSLGLGKFLRCALALVVMFALVGCGAVSSGDVKLDVPYYTQGEDTHDCGPASIRMWAGYDYYGTPPTQSEIAQRIGGATFGVSEQQIADGVNIFTRTNDAVPDWEGRLYSDHFMARQITSIDNYTPVIAVVDFNHAVVVTGGKWQPEGNWYQWMYSYHHDARRRAYIDLGSAQWIDYNCPPHQNTCTQIISTVFKENYLHNLNTYGDQVYDSSGCGGVNGCTPENQY